MRAGPRSADGALGPVDDTHVVRGETREHELRTGAGSRPGGRCGSKTKQSKAHRSSIRAFRHETGCSRREVLIMLPVVAASHRVARRSSRNTDGGPCYGQLAVGVHRAQHPGVGGAIDRRKRDGRGHPPWPTSGGGCGEADHVGLNRCRSRGWGCDGFRSRSSIRQVESSRESSSSAQRGGGHDCRPTGMPPKPGRRVGTAAHSSPNATAELARSPSAVEDLNRKESIATDGRRSGTANTNPSNASRRWAERWLPKLCPSPRPRSLHQPGCELEEVLKVT